MNFNFYFCVNPRGSKGGLVLLWNINANISILSYSHGHIDVLVNTSPNPFYFTGFYGNPIQYKRTQSWNLLKRIAETHNSKDLGWIVGGDFNEILFEHEKAGGKLRALHLINEFRNTLNDLSLSTVQSNGPWYTWDNKRYNGNRVMERLDRFLINDAWRSKYSGLKAANLDFFGKYLRSKNSTVMDAPLTSNPSYN